MSAATELRARTLLGQLTMVLEHADAPIPPKRPASTAPAAQPQPAPPAEGSLEPAIVADALEVVERSRHLPAAADVRIYLRAGRKYIRVFWVRKSSSEDLGHVLHFVEAATGEVYAARSSKAVGRSLGRFIARDEQAPASSAPALSSPPASSLREALRGAAPLTPQEVIGALGMQTAVDRGRRKRSGVMVRKHSPREVSVEWFAWRSSEDTRRARFDDLLERLQLAGYGVHLLSGEVGEEAVDEGRRRGIVLVHRPRPTESAHRPTPTHATHPDLALKGLVAGHRVAVEGEPYVIRAAAGGSPTRSLDGGKGTGPDIYELKHERTGRIARLRIPGVVERERDDASPLAGVIAVTFGLQSSFGDERTVLSPRVERLAKGASPRPLAQLEQRDEDKERLRQQFRDSSPKVIAYSLERAVDAMLRSVGEPDYPKQRAALIDRIGRSADEMGRRPMAERQTFSERLAPLFARLRQQAGEA